MFLSRNRLRLSWAVRYALPTTAEGLGSRSLTVIRLRGTHRSALDLLLALGQSPESADGLNATLQRSSSALDVDWINKEHLKQVVVVDRDSSFMFKGVREFLASTAGQVVTGLLIAVAVLGLIYSIWSNLGDSNIVRSGNTQMAVCSETGRSFEIELVPGLKFPVKSPYSGKLTGYAADEVCSWTEDGKVADEPTYVLMGSTYGRKGPTFCPTCHRLVTRNNPYASADRNPPPTEAEFAKTQSAGKKSEAGVELLQ